MNNKSSLSISIGRRLLGYPEINTMFAIIALSIIISVINPRFMTQSNLLTIFRWWVGLSILAIGQSMALIIAGIDLSVGSLASLSSMIFAYMLQIADLNTPLAILSTMGIAALIGLYHGLFVTVFSPPLPTTVPSFIVTLGSLILLRGIAIIMNNGAPIKIYQYEKIAFIQSDVGLAVIFFIVALFALIIQQYTIVGRYLYAIGGNMEAARVAGIPIHKARIFAYIISSICASITGIVYASLIASGYPDIATGQELYSIASCTIGGVSLAGGEGTLFGSMVGALLITIVRNGIVLMGVSPYWQEAVTAIILVIAVTVDLIRRTWRR